MRGPRYAAALAAGLVALTLPATSQAEARVDPDPANWGEVMKDAGCVQAHGWIAKLRGLGGAIDTTLFESHYPKFGSAHEKAGGEDVIDLKLPDPTGLTSGLTFGKGSGLYSESVGNKVPNDDLAGTYSDMKCAAYSKVGLGMIDAGIPDLDPFAGAAEAFQAGVDDLVKGAEDAYDQAKGWLGWRRAAGRSFQQMKDSSPFWIHAEGLAGEAKSLPGKPVEFRANFVGGHVSSFGNKVVDLNAEWPSNFGIDIDAPWGGTLGILMTDEQVTTDSDGRGHKSMEPNDASGYGNAIHASLLGTQAADLTIGHVAVLNTTPVSEGEAEASTPYSSDTPSVPPTIEPPVVEPPVVEPSVVEPPIVEPPVVEPPVVEPPVVPDSEVTPD